MALIKDGLWGIVNKTDTDPGEAEAAEQRKFLARRDQALAVIVSSVEPSLLYLIGSNPENPVEVWKKIQDHFQKKTWANKLQLRRKLYSLQLKEGELVQEHIRKMTEIFKELSVVEDPVSEKDKVVHLLSSLPDCFRVLVTALETNSETIPKMDVVAERLLHEEQKLKEKGSVPVTDVDRKTLTAGRRLKRRLITCHFCCKPGHIKRECWKLAQLQAAKGAGKKAERFKHACSK